VLEPGHRLEHYVVELLGPAPVEGDTGRHQAAAQPAPAPVAPSRPDHGAWPRAALAGLHSHRAYPIATDAGYAVGPRPRPAAVGPRPGLTVPPGPPARSTTRPRREARVMALPPADRYRHGCIPTPSRAPGMGPQGDVSEVGW